MDLSRAEDDPRPPYVQAAEVLRDEIADGHLKETDKLPSARTLQERYGLASSTVQNALRLLKTQGLVYTVQGRGTFVRQDARQRAKEIRQSPSPLWYASSPSGVPESPEGGEATTSELLAKLLDQVHLMNGQLGELRNRLEETEARVEQLEQQRGH
ncbi:GntR family transcriptional regulator [Streptomyces oryzae]|uniref:GntR family transcriptional regulator n=1 Tax=Streptomyces oryzae TaxID=1434886 RepID=A0ABS3XKR1_9ACTN|nr:GntR family transcriptional regulator [Streptomyces oryzae]MBO8195592.1 GntR family transcriptional regulator [Streptomyces oryzae]